VNGLVRVAIALGSNLDDRASLLDLARARLRSLLDEFRTSSNYETDPVGVSGHQPRFLNAAVVGVTPRSARSILSALEVIEREGGRERPFPGAARTLDLDLILFGDLIVDEPGLTVPHPRFRERRFVLEPLAAIAPQLTDPVTGKTVAELLEMVKRVNPGEKRSDAGRQVP
jgi:2-amino-4-hydroxy-6-hydroxymethyldihydropteridine diphosphokinase